MGRPAKRGSLGNAQTFLGSIEEEKAVQVKSLRGSRPTSVVQPA